MEDCGNVIEYENLLQIDIDVKRWPIMEETESNMVLPRVSIYSIPVFLSLTSRIMGTIL